MDQLSHAWEIWLGGDKLPDTFVLWGHTIIWWNRFGQLFQFLAALIVIFEIIGEERLRIFGITLFSSLKFPHIKDGGDAKFLFNCFLYVIFSLSFVYNISYAMRYLFNGSFVSNIVGIMLIGVLMMAVVFSASIIFLTAIVAISMLMSNKYINNIIKILGLLLAASGFHFTLLAS